MLPLKSLPKVLKHATPDRRLHNESPIGSEACGPVVGGHTRVSALATIGYGGNAANGSANSVASDNSSALSALETEEKALREQLIVLEEQKFFVTKMIADANKRRRFDEVSSLAVNIEDLTKEIDHINGLLNKLDFEGVYTGSQSTAWYNDTMSIHYSPRATEWLQEKLPLQGRMVHPLSMGIGVLFSLAPVF